MWCIFLSFSPTRCCFFFFSFLIKRQFITKVVEKNAPRRLEHSYLPFVHWGCVEYWFLNVWNNILFLTSAASFIFVLVNKSILHNLDISPEQLFYEIEIMELWAPKSVLVIWLVRSIWIMHKKLKLWHIWIRSNGLQVVLANP